MPQCNSIISIAFNNALENTKVWLNFSIFFQIKKKKKRKTKFCRNFRIIRDQCDFIPIDSYEIHRR